MLKAGALYFSIVIAFFIAVISAALLMLAAHYRSSYLKEIRASRLLMNLNSATAHILADQNFKQGIMATDLYGNNTDSAVIEKKPWGMYEMATTKVFISGDTLRRSFLMGKSDTSDLSAIYLSDEDRPLSVGGNARITGDALLPKSGIKASYVDGQAYQGQELVRGNIRNSKRTLPDLDEDYLGHWIAALEKDLTKFPWYSGRILRVSFFDSTHVFRLKPGAVLDRMLNGNVILYSDTTITIAASAHLNGIQIYAPFIKIEDGFKGRCQLFARDSISIGNGVKLSYPSTIAVLRTGSSGDLPKITTGKHFYLQGIMLSYEQKRSPLQTLIALGSQSTIDGEIYACGVVKLEKGVKIKGKVSCNRFLMQTPRTIYENFLIDVELNRKSRSKYYLSAMGLSKGSLENKVLQWLE